ncbi:hypothetical protein GLYMA_07G205600v4 [Glycine max]|uniref:Uncharacterized protein n=2 Tax=Glycine subgen. Soja TaxID=1462606 RepID=I1KLT5_SOYBN|nr:hypothetical protein GYH30_019050 [Glycine max]KRH50170.1 hypothetical protein GLYMA_07G205600v4 [Glycine max]RZC03857.1 hypothetical protein D0Y65_018487 [Glycine soja]
MLFYHLNSFASTCIVLEEINIFMGIITCFVIDWCFFCSFFSPVIHHPFGPNILFFVCFF